MGRVLLPVPMLSKTVISPSLLQLTRWIYERKGAARIIPSFRAHPLGSGKRFILSLRYLLQSKIERNVFYALAVQVLLTSKGVRSPILRVVVWSTFMIALTDSKRMPVCPGWQRKKKDTSARQDCLLLLFLLRIRLWYVALKPVLAQVLTTVTSACSTSASKFENCEGESHFPRFSKLAKVKSTAVAYSKLRSLLHIMASKRGQLWRTRGPWTRKGLNELLIPGIAVCALNGVVIASQYIAAITPQLLLTQPLETPAIFKGNPEQSFISSSLTENARLQV
jgi:hypothetical protein